MQSYPLRTIGFSRISNHDVTNETTNIVIHLHVGVDICRTAQLDGQRTFHQSQRIEVSMIDIGRERSNEFLCIQQCVNIELTTEQLVTTLDIKLYTSVAHDGKSSHVTHVPKTGFQLIDIDGGYRIRIG